MDSRKLVFPFWKGNEMYNESIMMYSEDNRAATGRFLFEPTQIISVLSSDLKTEYIEGKDWILEDGKIIRCNDSRMPFMKDSEVFFDEPIDEGSCFKGRENGYVLFKGKGYFHKRQISVTYHHDGKFAISAQRDRTISLPKTRKKLNGAQEITLCFYGDSITAGCDGSGLHNVEPFMKGWDELVCDALEEKYGCKITRINTAVGGKKSDWGAENAAQRLAQYKPDIAVVAFGMNDGTEKVLPEEFEKNIKSIMKDTLLENPDTEFILIAPTLPNPKSCFYGFQEEYIHVLRRCARICDDVVNMTEIHHELLKHKSFIDMTGNNINHPNDWLIRWYAQAILNLFY